MKLYRLQLRSTKSDTTTTTNPDHAESTHENVSEPSVVPPIGSSPSNVADWVEVGVGPAKLLRTKTAPVSAVDESQDNSESSIAVSEASNGKEKRDHVSYRLVMRRESSRGGPGQSGLVVVFSY